ncbi:MAG: tRNA (adenosine(37)-N6)-threonylcarbamoyltransferase complex ATPase subunit type 1 TsaE [Ruminococcus sp.]|nr:tRNA (adenosine(37)-N6)-threonylcarbamoyltransferase complex ATPase subunit type 1 TsaE [Ruminococcus sp.]
MQYEFITHTPEETIALAKRIGAQLRAGDCIAYYGDLGAGKTTFTRGLAQGMGLPDEVSSPTFAIVNEYHGQGALSLYHFDMYRIQSSDELETTGFYDYPMEESVFAVEWSENIEEAFPKDVIRIRIDRVDDDTRKITIEGDERFADSGN